jgi:hypothetical protein
MTDPEILAVLQRFAKVAYPIIRESFRVDSCIASTAITINVLSHHGIKAIPFPCSVFLMNAKFVELVERLRRKPTPQEFDEYGAWTVGVGLAPPGVKMVGHLVAMVEDKYLVDASLTQGNRPAKQIEVPPVLVARIPRNFRRGKETFKVQGLLGTVARYESQFKNKVWMQSRNWTDRSDQVYSVNKILAAMDPVSLLGHYLKVGHSSGESAP